MFQEIGKVWNRLDFVVHAIAFSDKISSRAAISIPHGITSCALWTSRAFRLRSMAAMRAAHDDGGSLLTLTYYGAERVMRITM